MIDLVLTLKNQNLDFATGYVIMNLKKESIIQTLKAKDRADIAERM